MGDMGQQEHLGKWRRREDENEGKRWEKKKGGGREKKGGGAVATSPLTKEGLVVGNEKEDQVCFNSSLY
ncbi:hypothetical protein GBA52_015964 [Prunus armeniaca]|nr:hypothetical protein GBA52_015964 [Prunus armeniaca]